MRLFECQNCHNAIHFDNTLCLTCHHRLGYVQDAFVMSAVEGSPDQPFVMAYPQNRYIFCDNARHGVCNWLIDATSGQTMCASCRHNRIVPDLSINGNFLRWQKIELAKRYLFRSLLRWNLPMPDRSQDPVHGLVFDLKADETSVDGSVKKILTGHDEGVITINTAEADDVEREARRTKMGESYRTLMGHLRHEVGHYFWDTLVRDRNGYDAFRNVFGDERVDYAQALTNHYANGPRPGWENAYISSYAGSHPWEDFAETWAHYLHMVDALETAGAYGIVVGKSQTTLDARWEPYRAGSAKELLDMFIPLTVAINSINRSMGQPDLYPFVLSNRVMSKLQYIHELIHTANGRDHSMATRQAA